MSETKDPHHYDFDSRTHVRCDFLIANKTTQKDIYMLSCLFQFASPVRETMLGNCRYLSFLNILYLS